MVKKILLLLLLAGVLSGCAVHGGYGPPGYSGCSGSGMCNYHGGHGHPMGCGHPW